MNAGQVPLYDIQPQQNTTEQFAAPITCEGLEAGQAIPVLAPSAKTYCHWVFVFDLAAFDSGPRTFTSVFLPGPDPSSGIAPVLSKLVTHESTVKPLAVAAMSPFIDVSSCNVPTLAGEHGCVCVFRQQSPSEA